MRTYIQSMLNDFGRDREVNRVDDNMDNIIVNCNFTGHTFVYIYIVCRNRKVKVFLLLLHSPRPPALLLAELINLCS